MESDDFHPLFRIRRPMIWTNPITNLGTAINVGIEFNRHGIVVTGDGRIGKTEAIGLLSRESGWRQYKMYWLRVLTPKPGQSSEGYFFNVLRLRAGLKIREQAPSIFSIHHCVNFLCEEAALLGAEVIVISIDDANRLHREDYTHLATLDSAISEMGFRLFVVLMVQQDADQSTIQNIDRERWPSQITGRFTADRYPYTGLCGVTDLRDALKAFSEQMWPPGSNITFLQRFAGAAYANGWRFHEHAPEFVDVIDEERAKHGLSSGAPFPMLCFDTSTYYLTVRRAGEDPHFEKFTPDDFRRALELSGYIPLELSRLPKDRK